MLKFVFNLKKYTKVHNHQNSAKPNQKIYLRCLKLETDAKIQIFEKTTMFWFIKCLKYLIIEEDVIFPNFK